VNGRVPAGTLVQFRPPDEFVEVPQKIIIARTSVYVPLSQSEVNHSDCALAIVDDPEDKDKIELAFPKRILSSAEMIDPTVGMSVFRVDETESARGEIMDVNLRMRIDYRFGTFEFDDLILIEGDCGRFARHGDSGAIVVDEETKRATAMVLGGTDTYTLACPLSTALAELAEEFAKLKKPPMGLAVGVPPNINLVVSRDDDREFGGSQTAGY
jgi:hypothetical protein